MPTLLVIRLHPVEPISVNPDTGAGFSEYLTGLSIAAHEVSFNDPAGSGPAFGTAAYIAPTLPPSPSPNPTPVQDPANRITQHFSLPFLGGGDFGRIFSAVATAVIEIPDPPAAGEFRTADVRLVITRNGNDIVHKQIYYNVPVAPAPIPANPNNFPNISDPLGHPVVSLHLALPSSGQQLSTTVVVPEDGTAPNFTNLRTAVENVLNAEPGNTTGIPNLAQAQCRHIAYEIIWDRMAYPLPIPNPESSLEAIYTGPQAADSDDERDRHVFEGESLTYYTKHNMEADRLANFVFSLSAAIWCEEESKKATRVGFPFPVIPTSPGREAKVILKGVGAAPLDPVFEIPAAYFYALTAILPPQVAREQRYKMVQLDSEAQIVTNIEAAKEDNVFTEPVQTSPGGIDVNPYQAARRLRALGLVGEAGTPECEVTPATEVHGLISHWLGSVEADINVFWDSLVPADVTGHLDLVLCAVTKHHDPLIDAIKNPAPLPDGLNVTNVNELIAKTNEDWEKLLHPVPVDPTQDKLPEFTKPGTREERTQAFIRYLRKFFDVANVFGWV